MSSQNTEAQEAPSYELVNAVTSRWVDGEYGARGKIVDSDGLHAEIDRLLDIALGQAERALADVPPWTWQEYQDAAGRMTNDGDAPGSSEEIDLDIRITREFYAWAARVLV